MESEWGKHPRQKNPPCKSQEAKQTQKEERNPAGLRSGVETVKVKVKMTSEASKAHLLLILGDPTGLEVAIFLFFHTFRSF